MPRTAQRPRPKYVFAVSTTWITEDGASRPIRTLIHQGEVWHAEHPTVVANPDLFADDPPQIMPRGWTPPVEQATAAPGEVRESTRA
jgi:hypothetical protein